MSFVTITSLPFRPILQNGSNVFACDIGSIRLLAADTSLLTGGPVSQQDPMTGAIISYPYSLNLPVNATLTPDPILPNNYDLKASVNSVLMGGLQSAGDPSSTGSISSVIPNVLVASELPIVFNYLIRVANTVGNPNQLNGVFTVDTFSGSIPAYYENAINASITNQYGITTPEVDNLVYGTAPSTVVSTTTGASTPAAVGLSNVKNVDTTNASNITGGVLPVSVIPVLPTSVIPPLSITTTVVSTSQAAQLALTATAGMVVVRTDLGETFINPTGTNGSMSDWIQLTTPTDTVVSVNGQIGTVSLTTANIPEGSNLYYTDARVAESPAVAANTAVAHTHSNKATLDETTAPFSLALYNDILLNTAKIGITTAQAAAIVANTAKVGITPQQTADILAADAHAANMNNPHETTAAQIGLGNVPNTNFTSVIASLQSTVTTLSSEVASGTGGSGGSGVTPQQAAEIQAAETHISDMNNPHETTATQVGLSNVPNLDLSEDVAQNTADRHTHLNKPLLDSTTAIFTTGLQNDILANNAKVGITPQQANAIIINSDKIGMTYQQISDILAADAHAINFSNPHEVTAAQVGLGNLQNVDLTAAVALNTAKVGITTAQATAIVQNTAKVGITPQQTADILAADAHAINFSNPHEVTAAQIGLGNLQNVDLTAAVALNTAKVGITTAQAAAIVANTAKVGITPQQASDILAADIHRATITGNPHQVTAAQVGLGNVPNVDWTDQIVDAMNHIADVIDNPHHVTATQVGLGNVKNIDTTNASNITTGTLPTSVLPPLAIADVYSESNQAAMLALTVHKGDICVRSDLSETFINQSGNNLSMVDWLLLASPTINVLSVNGQIGTVILTTTNISEGSNLYYTDTRVNANETVVALASVSHYHTNKALLDAVTAPFTTDLQNDITINNAKVGITPQQAADITAADAHAVNYNNPHEVTAAQIGLGNLQNVDLTAAVALNTAKVGITTAQAAAIVANTAKVGITAQQASDITAADAHAANMSNPHATTAAQVGLGNVPNVDFTATIAANTAKVGITTAQAAAIVANTAKVGITPQQAADILAADAHEANFSNPHETTAAQVGLGNVPNVDWTSQMNVNNAKVGITTDQAQDILVNNAKIGITPQQAQDILNADAHVADVVDNPHRVTAAQVGLGNLQNVDLTAAVALNTAKVGITPQQASDILAADAHAINFSNPHEVTAAQVGLGNLQNVDLTAAVAANTAKVGITTAQAAAIVANTAKVGITTDQASAIVLNTAKVGITTQQAADILAADAHVANITTNPHNVTAAQVGLSNVKNVDTTNASNITTGTLPTSVLPPLAIADVYAVASQTAQLALTCHKGDICVRTDLNQTFINQTGNNTAMTDWLQLATPIDNVLSVNGLMGTVVLTTSNIAEGSNLYYTDARVTANSSVANSAALAHSHSNKTILDATTASFTTAQAAAIAANTAKVGITAQQAADITAADAHAINFSNPHEVTAAQVGLGNLQNVDLTAAVAANTAKVGITTAQAAAIVANTAKVGITPQQTSDILAADAHALNMNNPHATTAVQVGLGNVPNVDWTAQMNTNNAKVGITTDQATAIAANTAKVGITAQQAADITAADAHAINFSNPHEVTAAQIGLGNLQNVDLTAAVAANTAKVGITTAQAAAIVANTAKVGITPQQTSDILAADAHAANMNNPHATTAAQVGLGNLQNVDLTAAVALNTAKVGITTAQAAAIVANTAKVGITAQQASDITAADAHAANMSNPHEVTAAQVGLGNLQNVDLTAAVALNTAKVGITTAQANAIVANTAKVGITAQQTADILAADAHAINFSNPHQTTAAQVGLGNVKNVDTTNASNITTGTLPSSVLPALAIADVYSAASQTAMLSLTVHKGDICVRSDLSETFINQTGNNTAMTDWLLLASPINNVLSVNGFTGTVVLTTSNIAEGTNLYYTDARVTANASVANSAALAHSHSNKALLDATTASFTTAQAAAIVANTAKVGITTQQSSDILAADAHAANMNNPHATTAAQVGLGNLQNVDLTAPVNAATAHISNTSNPHATTAAQIGLGNLQNVDLTAAVALNTAKVGITTAQANAIVLNTAKVGITPQQTADILAADAHAANMSNPHATTAAQVGLGNVKNVDCTNASNITTGTLPSSVLPPIAIADVYAVASQAAQLALTCHKGDICVRSDLSETFINQTGNNTAMTDWLELASPINNVLSVNGLTGTVVLTATSVGLGNVKNVDTTNASNITSGTLAVSLLPAITATMVGLGNVKNVDCTNASNITTGTLPVGVIPIMTPAQVGLGNVKNVDTTNASNITSGTLPTGIIPVLSASSIPTLTPAQVGLGNVKNVDTTNASNITSGTLPVAVIPTLTPAQVGLSNVKNVDTTNASNITTGTLPSSVLPPIAIADVYAVASQAAQLALTCHKGDICVRSDLSETFINQTGNNTAMTDWLELASPINNVLSVNGLTGTVVITAALLGLGNVKNVDTTNASNITTGTLPTSVLPTITATMVGLGNVKNVDCTNASNITTGTLPTGVLPAITATMVGLGNVKNVDTTNATNITTGTLPVAVIPTLTPAEVGLGNVKNVDTTNAANITAGTLPVAVVPIMTPAQVGLGNVPNTNFTSTISTIQASITTINGELVPATTISSMISTATAALQQKHVAGVIWTNMDYSTIAPMIDPVLMRYATYWLKIEGFSDSVPQSSLTASVTTATTGIVITPDTTDLMKFRIDIGNVAGLSTTTQSIIVTFNITLNDNVSGSTPFTTTTSVPVVYDMLIMGTVGLSGTEQIFNVCFDNNGGLTGVGGTTDQGNGGGSGTDAFLFRGANNYSNNKGMTLGGTGTDSLKDITLMTGNDTYICVGSTNSVGDGGYDGIICRFDTNLTLLYKGIWGTTAADYFMGVRTDPSGNVFAAGYTATHDADFDNLIVKFDTNLNVLSAFWFGTSGKYDYLYDVCTLSTGAVVCVGTTNGNSGSNYGASIALLTNALAMTTYSVYQMTGASNNCSFNSVVRDANNVIYAGGNAGTTGRMVVFSTALAVTADINIVYGTSVVINDIGICSNGNFVLCGTTVVGGISLGIVITLSSTFALIHAATFGGTANTYFSGIAVDMFDNVITVGYTSCDGEGATNATCLKWNNLHGMPSGTFGGNILSRLTYTSITPTVTNNENNTIGSYTMTMTAPTSAYKTLTLTLENANLTTIIDPILE